MSYPYQRSGTPTQIKSLTEYSLLKKVLLIQDTGTGFTEDSKAHLFTPFFSTKKNGQGVGLIMIRDILMNHGFNFSLNTTAAGLTEFRIEFGN
ncbi:sensor histidine kinase [bacterium]|nr:sensor histidine kinase [bacterium]